MILKSNQVCPYKDNCKYHNKLHSESFCHGANPLRNNNFNCGFVDDDGKYVGEGTVRSVYDITGKMEFINEG